MHHGDRVAAINTLQHLYIIASLAVFNAIPRIGAAGGHVKLGVLQRMDGEEEVLACVATAVRRNGGEGKGDAAVGDVLFAWRIDGLDAGQIAEAAIAVG